MRRRSWAEFKTRGSKFNSRKLTCGCSICQGSGVRSQDFRNKYHTNTKIGTKIGIVYLKMYAKKLGVFAPAESAMALTMKFGPLPMYVHAPKKTAPSETARR